MRYFSKTVLRSLSLLLLIAVLFQPAMAAETAEPQGVMQLEPEEVEQISDNVYNDLLRDAAPGSRSVSKEALAFLAAGEGFAPHPVWDYSQWSAGHGSNYQGFRDLFPDQFPYALNGYSAANAALAKTITVTREQAQAVMAYYVQKWADFIGSYLQRYNVQVNQNQFDALVLFSYGLGGAWTTGKNSDGTKYKIRILLEDTDPSLWTYERVEEAMIVWSNAGGVRLASLERRHRALAKMFTTPYEEPEPEREPIEEFTDVYVDDWYADAVREAYARGIMQGKGDGIFDPGENLKRAEMVMTLANMMGVNLAPYQGRTVFSDVPLGQWYTAAVAWGNETGLVTGFGNGLFDPEASIQRQHVCVILEKYLKSRGVPAGGIQTVFLDSDQIQLTSQESVRYCVSLGIMSGMGDGTFQPAAPMTRAQIASVLVRTANLLGL